MEFSKACTDVGYIIQYMEEEDRKKIPEDFIETINYFKADDYETSIDITIPLEEQKLSKATEGLIAFIYNNFFGTEEEKNEYNNNYKNYLINTNTEVFPQRQHNIEIQNKLILKENKKSFFARIIEKIKSYFA